MDGLFGLVWICGVSYLCVVFVVEWYSFIFWVHLVSSCIIFCGRCGSSFFKLSDIMGNPLAILSLMMEYACGMVVVVVVWWGYVSHVVFKCMFIGIFWSVRRMV